MYFQKAKTTDKFEEVVKTISDLFSPAADTDASIIAFRQMTQRMNENMESFMVTLKSSGGCTVKEGQREGMSREGRIDGLIKAC